MIISRFNAVEKIILVPSHSNIDERLLAFSQWLVRFYHCTIPLVFCFVISGAFIEHGTTRLLGALYVALERPIYSIICTVCLFGMVNNVDSKWRSCSVK